MTWAAAVKRIPDGHVRRNRERENADQPADGDASQPPSRDKATGDERNNREKSERNKSYKREQKKIFTGRKLLSGKIDNSARR